MGPWPRAARLVVRLVLRTLFRLRLEGSPPARGPYILVANHQGWSDAFVLIALLSAEPRVYFIGDRRAVTSAWWKRAVLRSLGVVVPVERDASSERAAVDASLRLLRGGAVLGIFAEGRVSNAEASLAPFQRGVGYLAVKARASILPVWLRGTAELYLGRELVGTLGRLRPPPPGPPTKQVTSDHAAQLHRDLEAIAVPWTEPVGVRKRWRWLTHLL